MKKNMCFFFLSEIVWPRLRLYILWSSIFLQILLFDFSFELNNIDGQVSWLQFFAIVNKAVIKIS